MTPLHRVMGSEIFMQASEVPQLWWKAAQDGARGGAISVRLAAPDGTSSLVAQEDCCRLMLDFRRGMAWLMGALPNSEILSGGDTERSQDWERFPFELNRRELIDFVRDEKTLEEARGVKKYRRPTHEDRYLAVTAMAWGCLHAGRLLEPRDLVTLVQNELAGLGREEPDSETIRDWAGVFLERMACSL